MGTNLQSFSRPVIGGVFQPAGWDATLTVEGALRQLGRNSGNMMFTESLRRVLKNSVMSGFGFDRNVLADRDIIVLAAANWINEYEDFGWLYQVLANVKLPVMLVGVGAQASLSNSIPKLKPGTLNLLKLVAERSVSIGARGEFTCDVLNHYGIKSGVVTGCPSMLLVGKEWPQAFRLPTTNNVVLHATRHGFGLCDEFQRFLYSQAMRGGYDILLQSEEADIYYALRRTGNDDIMAKAWPPVSFAYSCDEEGRIASYLANHGLFYLNYPAWIDGMASKTFCFGTRIHGTIASLISGTPAVLIAHDSRTLELAKSMSLPYVVSTKVSTVRDLDLTEYMNLFRSSDVGEGYRSYRSRFMSFFQSNGLTAEW